jgi:pyruvate formate lyase activating enzyme
MEKKALLFDIKRGSSEDGPGIRTTLFFKGCPLSCVWCHNPEGISRQPEVDCSGQPVGFYITLDELLYRVKQDRSIFASSGGGVTLSGGEPTQQMEFLHHLLVALKELQIHTAIETCGLFNYDAFKELLLPWLDLIYFDLKLVDDFQSRRFTGSPNKTILENFSRLNEEAEITVVPRIPLIPGITDSKQNLTGLARYLRQQGVDDCTLMPYNPTWQEKLRKLGKKSDYSRETFLTEDEQQASIDHFRSFPNTSG